MNTELIVPFNKGGMKHGFSGTILLLIFFLYLFYVSTGWQNIVGYYAYICIRIFLNFIIACLVFAAVFGYYLVTSPEPALILNKNGIWIKYYNFIPWENIEEVVRYCLPTTPIEALGIRVKDPSVVSKNASWEGKSTLFWARILGYYYQITITGIDLEHEEVVAFARQFLK